MKERCMDTRLSLVREALGELLPDEVWVFDECGDLLFTSKPGPVSGWGNLKQLVAGGERLANGGTVEGAVVAQDIHHLRKLYGDMCEETKHWQAVFHAVSDGIVVTEPEGRIIAVNQSAATLLRVEQDQLVGRSLGGKGGVGFGLVLTPVGRADVSEEHFFHLLQADGMVTDYECLVTNAAGEEYCLIIDGVIVQSQLSSGERYVFTFRDITELRSEEKTKDHFVQLMGHELRNPLQVIRGITSLLRMQIGNRDLDSTARHVERLDQQVQQLITLINEMVTAYLSRSDYFTIRPSSFELVEFLQQVVSTFSTSITTHKIVFCPCDHGELEIRFDPQRLIQVMNNLLSNAVKYSPERTRIWVNVGRDEEYVFIRVEDEGMGIPVEHLEKIFTSFHRVEELSHGTDVGLGLGLFISRNIARRHGGDLRAANRPREGVVFTLEIPLDDHTNQETEEKELDDI